MQVGPLLKVLHLGHANPSCEQIFQGLAPSFIGSLSDETGRRPSYIVCFVIYICACLGLALQNSYAALMVLRCLQSSGSSGTVALANAVVADIATSSERGMYIGYVSMGALLGPAIGPILGGIINEFAGWRWIFWFLTIFGGVVLCTLLVLLPETCRKIVGNGALPAQRWNLSLLNWLARRQARKQGIAANDSTRSNFKARPNPINTIYVIADKESGIVLLYAGVIFAGYYMLLTSFTSEFAKNYKFNSLQVGLCYIPSGMGSFTAAVVTGRTVDWNFRRLAKSIGMELHSSKQPDLTHFPIEKARLQVLLPIAISASAFTVAYGWSMEARTSLAAPLIFNFCVSFCVSSTFQGTSTLVVDLNQDRPGTATAAMNLVRCWLGAGATAMAIPMINRMGIGWVSVFIAGVWLALSPIILLIIRYGPGWRAEKRQKLDRSRLERERLERERAGGEAGGGGP